MGQQFAGDTEATAAEARADLRAELDHRDLPRHLALFYESTDLQMDAIAAFLEYGLTTGHKCLYLLDVSTRDQILDALRSTTVDVDRRLDAGDLVVRDAAEVYLDAGFDPDRMIQTLEESCLESQREGYDGLCVAGENFWCFHTEMPFDYILDFEADFDATCPDLPVIALCQYDLTRFGTESAAKALWTHETVIYRNLLCDNPFYVPPDEYRSSEASQLNVRLMLEQAHSLTHSRRTLRRHEQRLDVVNRVLRHNIRNDLNVIQGNLQQMAASESLPPALETRLDQALEHATQIPDVAEKARYVQQTLEFSTVEATHLGSLIDAAVDEVEDAHPEADVEITGPRDVAVLTDTNFDMALSEALSAGIVHQDADPPTVTLSVSRPSQDLVRIDVEYLGSIPESELRPIQEGAETLTDHASGLGLWLVTWLVENSHGSIAFPETESGRATIRIELTRVPG
ncbi:MAG: MEDS domain-containing protein [Halobacteriaceae archaeon]